MALIRDVAERSATMIQGQVQLAGDALVAPATLRPCVYWELDIDAGYGFQLLHSRQAVDFLVVDASGRARIRAREATFRLRGGETVYAGVAFGVPVPMRVAEILAGHGQRERHWLRLRERTLGEGDTVQVSGFGTWEADPTPAESGYRDRAMRLVLGPALDTALVVKG